MAGPAFLISDDGQLTKDDTGRFYVTLDGSVVPVPTPGANIIYIFRYSDSATEAADAAVSNLQTTPVTAYDMSVSSTVPLPGVWIMAVQGGELSPALSIDPNLVLVIARGAAGINQQKAIFSRISTKFIRIIAANIGTIVDNGLP